MADQLPLVQHALFWMWEQAWRGAGLESPPRPTDDPPAIVPPLSLAEFRENDGLKGIMQRHAEELYASAVKGGNSAKQLCELVFKRLCERDLERRYRRTPPTISELQDLTGASEDELRAVIAPFTASSAALLSVRPQAGRTEDVIDINHESLIRQWDRLRGWADEEAREVATFRELVGNARQWEDSNKDERHLRTGGQLELIETFWKRTNPSDAWAQRYRTINRKRSLADDLPLVEEYVVASRSEEERRQNAKARRRVRDSRNRLISVVGALAVAAVTVGAIGLFQERERQTSVLAAQLGKLAGGDNPIDALLIAESAITQDLSMTPELQGLLQSTVNGFRLETELRGSDLERIAFSPTGNDLLIADAQGDLQMWNGDDQQLSPVEISQRNSDQEQAEQDQVAKRFEWSPDGKFVFISDGSGGGHAAIYEVVSTSEGTSLNEAFPVDKMSRRAQFSPDGALLVTSGFSGTQVELWKLEDGSGRLNWSIRPSSWGLDAAFSSDGRHLALASNGNVDIYEVSKLLNGDYDGTDDVSTSADEEKAATPIGRKAGDRWFELAFHPSDPNMLAIATRSGVGKLWELRQDKELHELGKFFEADDGIRTIAISPDGRWIATSGQDGDTWLAPVSAGWDKETSKAEMLAGRDQIEGLSFSFDSSRLASVSENGVVRIWSIEPRSDELTVDFTRDDWLAALERLKPTVVGPSGDAVPLQLDPKLECLVSPTAAGCAE